MKERENVNWGKGVGEEFYHEPHEPTRTGERRISHKEHEEGLV